MPTRHSHQCPHRETAGLLVREKLAGQNRQLAQQHLEECESCRTLFRQLTGDAYPRFRNYTIIERIGEGGFGVVYKVIHHAKERTEALKVLFGKTPIREAYFQNEVHLIAKLQHPHIATLYEAHLSTPPLYYTMEFVEGEQLDSYFRSQHVPLVERINIVKSVAKAVGYAHEQGVVHRDIKPQNILIDSAGQPRIVDFGIAKKLGLTDDDEDGKPRSPEGVLGTFGYIAPEQIASEPVDARADVFALGALLYHSITGEPAKLAGQPERLLHSLRERQVLRAEDLAAIISHCVAPVPENRYGSCEELIADIEHYLTGRKISVCQNTPLAYRLLRGALYALRSYPLSVRFFATVAIAGLLTILAWRAEARWSVSGNSAAATVNTPSTTLVVFSEQTIAAIANGSIGLGLPGLDATNRRSWRLIHGRLLQLLAQAAPRAVIFDYHIPECHPEYDSELLKGLEAMRAADIPVVIGAREFDINSEPKLCANIRKLVYSYGSLASTTPDTRAHTGAWVVPICFRRGFAKPVPGLAVAGFAAARHPRADVDLEVHEHQVVLRYRRHQFQAGEPEWHTQTTRIPIMHVDKIERVMGAGMLQPGDLVFQMHIETIPPEAPATPRIPLEDVLDADRAQLQKWFDRQTIVVGDFLPSDQYSTVGDRKIFGCEVHVDAIRSLLAEMYVPPFAKRPLAATIFMWCALAALLVEVIPRGWATRLRATTWVCLTAFVAGVLLVTCWIWWETVFWEVQVALALGSLMATGSVAYLLQVIRDRQIQLAPEGRWAPDDDTVDSTMLATLTDGTMDSTQSGTTS
ncbi:MAG: protein kinase [Planctomycetota bacterium]